DETSARAGLTYLLSPRLMVRGSYGEVVEFPRANLVAYAFTGADFGWYSMLAPDFPVKPQLDRTKDIGLEYIPNDSTLISATYFDRDSRQMIQRWQGVVHDDLGNWVLDDNGDPILSDLAEDFDPFAPVWFASNGNGTSKGVELKVDHRMTKDFRAWLAYTRLDARATSPRDNVYPFGFGFSDRTDPEGLGEQFRLPWDQTDTVTLVAAYRKGKLVINPWMQYGSGFPFAQSGLDAGGSDPAHVPNPDFDPGDPASPEELLIPENLLDPTDPAGGFVSPDDLTTGDNFTLSLNLWYDIGSDREAYLHMYNILGSDDVTSKVIYHPQTGAVIGRIEGDSVFYAPFSTTPPRFFAFGIRQWF
ncbi:MAG: TonB-dependent receptor, partial [Gemmatimonadales bacterium]|nr:TonB-dependent receptor [Gemmatimonadales bacterium]